MHASPDNVSTSFGKSKIVFTEACKECFECFVVNPEQKMPVFLSSNSPKVQSPADFTSVLSFSDAVQPDEITWSQERIFWKGVCYFWRFASTQAQNIIKYCWRFKSKLCDNSMTVFGWLDILHTNKNVLCKSGQLNVNRFLKRCVVLYKI